MSKELQIRNSTVDFLVFTRDAGEDGIEVRVQNGDVWLTQKAISQLFDVDRSVVTKHLSNIFKEGELDENSVCAKFAQTADDGKTYNYKFYSLAAIIAVGYRINSERAMQFRTWATKVLDLMEDEEFIKAVEEHPKLFTGFSDTTINHLMFYKLGLSTYYGPNFICDLGEIADEMLPYTKRAFESYLEGNESDEIISSDTWYEEREDFSRAAIGTERKTHKEERGFELLQGSEIFQGGLLGGCLESLYDILTNSRYEDEKEVCERYDLFPNKEEWIGKILFIETCEEKPTPELFEREVLLLKEKGVFDVVNGVLVGKPQDEAYYQEYKDILIRVIDNEKLPIVYNVNFGHAMPRCALQYGAVAKVDMKQKKIYVNR